VCAVSDLDIHVDVTAQQEIFDHFGVGRGEDGLPIFPLNTDGIDPSGRNFLIENVTIQRLGWALPAAPPSHRRVVVFVALHPTCVRRVCVHAASTTTSR
jgi:hypothetical protein